MAITYIYACAELIINFLLVQKLRIHAVIHPTRVSSLLFDYAQGKIYYYLYVYYNCYHN
jgi:hypothetical protein